MNSDSRGDGRAGSEAMIKIIAPAVETARRRLADVEGPLAADALEKYVTARGEISPAIDGRITIAR